MIPSGVTRSVALGLLIVMAAPELAVPVPLARTEQGSPIIGVAALIDASAPSWDVFNAQFCGGVLVQPDQLLTAAHCVVNKKASNIQALVGADNLCRDKPIDGRRIDVSSILVHPLYDPNSASFDLAILALSQSVQHDVRKVSTVEPSGQTVIAVGWGRVTQGGVPGCRLTRIELRLSSQGDCLREIAPDARHEFDPESMICGEPVIQGMDSCSGDSGGPLFLGSDPDTAPVVGIVSWGRGCADGVPGVYARAATW